MTLTRRSLPGASRPALDRPVRGNAGRPRAAAAASDASATSLASLDAFVEAAMKDWAVPGLGLAVVRDGEVVLARGYGVRAKGKADAVDADTVFAIGSSSKAFTAACIGLLVDQKKVGWDDPVTKHLPGFQLHDAYATRDLTVRDLLTHRSGLARADQLWYGSGFDRAEILERFRYVEPSWGFRARFGYQNIMFLAAGELYAAVAGESWDDCVAKRFFAPLRMARSTTSVDPLPGMDNVATPHEEVEGKVVAGAVVRPRQRGSGRVHQLERARDGGVGTAPTRRRPGPDPHRAHRWPRCTRRRWWCARKGAGRATSRRRRSSPTGWAGSSTTTAARSWSSTAARSTACARWSR